jgi:hypothetical protein
VASDSCIRVIEKRLRFHSSQMLLYTARMSQYIDGFEENTDRLDGNLGVYREARSRCQICHDKYPVSLSGLFLDSVRNLVCFLSLLLLCSQFIHSFGLAPTAAHFSVSW